MSVASLSYVSVKTTVLVCTQVRWYVIKIYTFMLGLEGK
jgi:hypothetical protein